MIIGEGRKDGETMAEWAHRSEIEHSQDLKRQEAASRAAARNDWYVMVPGAKAMLGPVSEANARKGIDDAVASGLRSVKLLRVVEDYES